MEKKIHATIYHLRVAHLLLILPSALFFFLVFMPPCSLYYSRCNPIQIPLAIWLIRRPPLSDFSKNTDLLQ